MIEIAEARGDALVLIDPTHDIVTVAEAREFINGGGGTYTGSSINSSYAAYYWPWVEVFDGHSGEQVFVPPSGIVAGIMARNDRLAESWYAPAGFNRGIIKNAVRVAKNSTLGEREALYAAGEVVNPIVNFSGLGITIWGQKTTQRRATALNRVNVRRMLNFAKKIIATSVKFLVFEPNDKRTWRRFINIVTPPLESIKSRRGLFDFKVICDETTNPALQIDRNEMRGIILMKPTKTAEIVTIDFTLLSTGAQFNEFLEG
jgi:phage tail sheath protein FI